MASNLENSVAILEDDLNVSSVSEKASVVTKGQGHDQAEASAWPRAWYQP